MDLFKLFQSRSKGFYLFLLLLSLVSSLTNIGILMLVNMALGGKPLPFIHGYTYQAFLLLLAISYFATSYFQKYMVELTNTITYQQELSLIGKVRNAAYESFEKMGPERVYSAISDTRVLSRVPGVFVTLINSSVTIICSLLYLLWVSPLASLVILVLMTALLLVYLYKNKKIEKDLNKVRDLQDAYYVSLRELLAGFRQIRISSLRNNNLYTNFILANRDKSRELNVSTSKKYVDNELIGTFSWYIVLGVVIFLLPILFKVSTTQMAAFITTVLFMMSPVSQLILFFPFYTTFKISVERIAKIDKQLGVATQLTEKAAVPARQFRTIRFENIVYKYDPEDKNSFRLELPDFQISKEEILFVSGANGSGKTTFINVLTGLCKPTEGKIYIDEKEIRWEEFCAFSNNMAVVYTNHHMFRENYDEHDLSESNEQLKQLTSLVNLEGVLKIDRENERIETRLSKGQQKRLALLLALLEDKQIIILDEWAAEQDPVNRRFFYTEWLDIIRGMGKTIIAVSHDDDFYHVADRLMKFDYGKAVIIKGSVETAHS
jgi:ABC-type siderophore export system fused ATPase/permease subunit